MHYFPGCDDVEAGNAAESEFRIGKSPQVVGGDGSNELIAKGLSVSW